MSKKRNKRRGVILGFDETNNGFHIKSYNPHSEGDLVITGYVIKGPKQTQYGSSIFEHKKKIFNGGRNIKRALERGRYYLNKHPDFLYTIITKKQKNKSPITILKANAIALLSFEFFLRYDLNPSKTELILDEMDGKSSSRYVNYILDLWLQQSGLNIPHNFKRKADKNTRAVRKADRCGYYLAAIHFLGDYSKWPYRSKKVNISQLEEKCARIKEIS